MRRLFTLLWLMFCVSSVFAQSKRPFTFEDMMKLKRVGEPEVSPDGKWVIFSVVDVSLEANTKTPHIWIVPTAGGQERGIIADQDADRPRWSPDGKRFAFISTKEEGSQVWIADFDATNGTVSAVHPLTWISTGASGEVWSPDGKNILFVSDVYPECDGTPEPEAACNAKKLKDVEHSKVKAQVFDHLLYRHWNAYKDGKRSHIFVMPTDDYNGKQLATSQDSRAVQVTDPRDLTPGDYDAPVFSLGGQDDYAFSPDGQEICYTSNHDKNPAASTNNDLWIVSVNGGAAKDITADNPASDSTPLYSPDGKYIAYRAQKRPGDESDRFRLMLYDRKTRRKHNITENFDLWVGTFTWSRNSRRVYISFENFGEQDITLLLGPGSFEAELPEFDAQGLPVRKPILPTGPLGFPGYNDDLTITPDGKNLLVTRMSISSPPEIFISPSEGTCKDVPAGGDPSAPVPCEMPKASALTHINDAVLSRIAMSPLETFYFHGANDDRVQGFLVKPPNFDPGKKYPVKFLIHGGPEGAWGDDWSYRWNPELFAANGYVVIMINFHGSTGYGQKFIDAINGDWGGAPFEDLMKGLDYAEQTHPFIDKDRECALGASYGGYAINWILGHTDRFKCLVSHDGMFNAESAWGSTEEIWFNNWEFKGTPYDNREMYQKWSPHQYAKNFKTPTLVVHGQLDYRLDVSEGFQLFTTLQMLGVPSKMLYFPDEGHWVLKPQNSELWYKTVNDWVDRWVK